MAEYRLPAALVEKIKAALNDPTMFFVEKPEHMADWIDRATVRVAAALLDGCEVRERYQLVGKGRGLSSAGWVEFLGDDLAFARRAQADEPDAALMRRLQLTTPLEPVDPPLVAPFPRLEGPPGEEPG